jgi:hypothetical protein
VTFVGASSNTVIDTTTGSLGVGVDGNGPSSNLHVVGHTRLEGDINMLHTANTASIKLNSNVVTEFPRSKKLIKYPRVALGTGGSPNSGTGGGYTLSGYTVKASDEYNTTDYTASKAFTNTNIGSGDTWISGSAAYTSSDGLPVANSATVAKFGQNGSWIEVGLPNTIQLHSTRVFGRHTHFAERSDTADIWASNTGNDGDWVKLTTINFNDTYTDVIPMVADIDTQAYYQYFAIQITKIEWNGTYANIGEWELFGTPEYDPEADGVDVVVKSVPNVPNTDWLEVYYDAKDLVDGAVSTAAGAITGLGGTTNNGTAYGGVTVSDGAFVFDGSGDYIESGLTINAVGTPQHTFSLWVKPSTGDMDDTNNHYLCVWGNTTAQNSWSGLALTGGKLLHAYHASGKYTSDVLFTTGNWHHIVVVIKSTIETVAIDRDADFYVDGVLYSGSYSTLGSQAGNSAYYLNWGSGTSTRVRLASLLSGGESSSSSIANFRLFNRALTQDEIYQLYAYQKEYFGHGDLSMTLKAGRLGIGTSEPRAALDVRGRIMREYNPGEVIETIQGKANGRYVKVQSGTYLLPNVDDIQDLTSTHTRINGSNFDYTPPPGTTRVIYEFWFFLRRIDDSPILHVAGRVDGSQVNDARHTFRHQTDNIGTDPQIWIYNHMCVSIGEVTSDNIADGQVATWNGPRTIDFSARRYSGSFDARLHKTNHWDGSGADILVRPIIKITAIA